MTPKEFYESLQEKKPFTELTSTGISDNLPNVFEFAKIYAEAITVTPCCTELNHDFSIGDDAWLIEKKIVEINDFCATPDRIEIIDDGKYRLVDIDQLNKVV